MFVHKLTLFLAVIFVSGCGFKTLYGSHSAINTPAIEYDLTQIKVLPLPDRTGQILYNHLLDKLTPAGKPTNPKAYLHIDLSLNKHSISLRRDGTTQRFNMIATAKITLKDKDDKKTLYEDTIKRTASFSIGDATAEFGYASTVSESDSKRRTILLIAEDLHLMLATYYQKWPSSQVSRDRVKN